MNIEGLGEALVDQLIEEKLIQKIPDLYKLKHEDLVRLERMGPKSSQNLLDEIEKTKQRNLDRLIYALGIRFVGERTAQSLASHFKNLEKLAKTSSEQLIQIEDVGPKVAESIVFFFKQPENIELIKKLKEASLNLTFREEERRKDLPLAGQTFVLTGSLESLTREEAAGLIEAAGGTVSSAVSSKTDYVIVGESPGSKLAKAKKLGIRTIKEKGFLRLVGKS